MNVLEEGKAKMKSINEMLATAREIASAAKFEVSIQEANEDEVECCEADFGIQIETGCSGEELYLMQVAGSCESEGCKNPNPTFCLYTYSYSPGTYHYPPEMDVFELHNTPSFATAFQKALELVIASRIGNWGMIKNDQEAEKAAEEYEKMIVNEAAPIDGEMLLDAARARKEGGCNE